MKVFGLLFSTLLFVTVVNAQRADFSGEWVLDEGRTIDAGRGAVDELRRRDYERQGLTRKVTRVLTISHKDPVLEVSQRSIVEVTDRNGNLVEKKESVDFSQTLNTKDEWEEGALSAKVKARWKGDKVESTIQAEADIIQPGRYANAGFPTPTSTSYQVRTYQLSRGGRELIVESRNRSFDKDGVQGTSGTVRLVFRKVE